MHTYKGPKDILNPGINFNRGSVAFFVGAGAIQGFMLQNMDGKILCVLAGVCIIPVRGEIGLVIK